MIDWFTVIAQIINFVILIALLKYFLYGRIVATIDQREKNIAGQREQAEQNIEQSLRQLESAKQKNRQLDEQREQLLATIKDELEVFRRQQLDKVRADVDGIQSRWSESIREERNAFLNEFRKQVSESVCVIARRALADLADATLESQIVARFLSLVKSLDDQERASLTKSLSEADQSAIVQTTHELTSELKSLLVQELRQELQVEFDVRFERLEDLQCGIALQTNSHKLGWNLRDYLTAIEEDLQRMMDEEASRKTVRSKE